MTGSSQHATRRPQIWAVGGGKGGTGKSLVSASLGIHLARTGRRVVLVDGDLGAPNLHTALGIAPPPLALSDFIKRRFESFETIVSDTGVPGLSIISGARNSLDVDSLKHFQKTRLMRLLVSLPADVVLIDLGAGTSLNVLDPFTLADRGVLVVLPEPTSIENAYRFLKAAYLRRLQHLGRALGHREVIDLVVAHRDRAEDGRPAQILEEIGRIDTAVASALSAQMEAFVPHLVINQARAGGEEALGESIAWVSGRFLQIPMCYAGAIPHDPAVLQCARDGRAYLSDYPRARTALRLRSIADAVLHPAPPAGPLRGPWVAGSRHLRSLDLMPGATQDEILRAYLRHRRTLRSDSPALAPLDCDTERRAAIVEIESAYRSLSRNLSCHPVRERAGFAGAVV